MCHCQHKMLFMQDHFGASPLLSVCVHVYFLCQGPCSIEAKKLFKSVPLFSGVYHGPLRWILGSCPFPSPLILKISLKEHIPVLTKKETEQKKEKLHEIAHFRGRLEIMCWVAFPPQTHCTPLRLTFCGQAVERTGWVLMQWRSEVWCGVTVTCRAVKRKGAWSCRSCRSRLSTHVRI